MKTGMWWGAGRGLAGTSFLLLLAAGCGTAVTSYQCNPACPSGFRCEAGGCVGDSVVPDIGGQPHGDLAVTCSPACSGATPFCDSTNTCVECLASSDCPRGEQCKKLGTLPTCQPGCDVDQDCPAQGKCCDHACIDPMTDPGNCGGCGNHCTSTHATSSCAAGACQSAACLEGWGDCNNDPADGCEASLASDPANCGHCATACQFDHATAACSNTCYIAACEFGFGDCDESPGNGCEGNTLSDIKNCGSCGNVCNGAPHAKVGCINASCVLTECAAGFGDCDGSSADGCETPVLSDAKNCGVCGLECPMGLVCRNGACTCPNCNFPNAVSKCINNMCAMGKCLDGFGDCDGLTKTGCEVDLTTDSANCAACGVPCGKGQTCIAGVCEDVRPDVMQCGNSDRNATDFFPMGMMFNLRAGCNPDDQTQALLISRNWGNAIGANALQDYLNAGGVVITEFSISHLVWNAAFGTNTPMGPQQGNCSDKFPTMFQFSPDDQFWQDNVFTMDRDTGCGFAVQNYPGITPVSGWDAVNVAVGYQDLGSGRLWASDFDWQDTDTKGPAYDYTNGLIGYMITHRR